MIKGNIRNSGLHIRPIACCVIVSLASPIDSLLMKKFVQLSLVTLSKPFPGGIHFKFEKNILLAESYTRIKFLVPFPKEPAKLNSTRSVIASKIEVLWAAPTIACEIHGTDQGRNITTSFEWIENVIDEGRQMMRKELTSVDEDLRYLLNIHAIHQQDQPLMRRRRLAAAAVAVGAACVFGGGMAVGSTIVCALKGIFGSCNKEGKKNAWASRELTGTTDCL